VNEYLDHYDDVVQTIHVVMGKLCYLKNISELKKLTDLNSRMMPVGHPLMKCGNGIFELKMKLNAFPL
jgi:hypothetical protein